MDEDLSDYTDAVLNIILDEIDDIIIIHDSNHTVVWINRAGLKELGMGLSEVMGKKCYRILGRSCCCEDCAVAHMAGAPVKSKSLRSFPALKENYMCTSIPVYRDGEMKMVVQHLNRVCPCEGRSANP
jgi:transcriptional regulator with PAS, ATPase and Fis domain